MGSQKIQSMKQTGVGLSIIIFPIMLLFGFVTHPNIFSFEIVTEATAWADEWRGVFMFHFGHLLVLFAVPLIIVTSIYFMSLLKGKGESYGFSGAVLGVFGAFMLAVDKGSLTLVLSAFQTISDDKFNGILPALQSLLDRDGWLWITWMFLALPIGFIIQTIGLLKENIIPKWQGVSIIVGLLLLINPDIEIISTFGAVLMCAGFIPIGLRALAKNSV